MSIQWSVVRPSFRTKFTDEATLDLVNFEVNIKAQLVAGVSGIILGGTLDEASTLTFDEKRILIKKSIKIVKGKSIGNY